MVTLTSTEAGMTFRAADIAMTSADGWVGLALEATRSGTLPKTRLGGAAALVELTSRTLEKAFSQILPSTWQSAQRKAIPLQSRVRGCHHPHLLLALVGHHPKNQRRVISILTGDGTTCRNVANATIIADGLVDLVLEVIR